MPVADSQAVDSIFFARHTGAIQQHEAERWLAALAWHTATAPEPVVVLIDATEADFFALGARLALAQATRLPGVAAVVIAAHEPVVVQSLRLTQIIGNHQRTHFLSTLPAAYAQAVALTRHLTALPEPA